MNVTCIICSDQLLPSSEIYASQCGHIFHYICLIQWIERSKTCPQCRNRATEKTIHRIYFNVANTDHIVDDVVTLQNKLDSYVLKLNSAQRELCETNDKCQKTKAQNKGLRKEIATLEDKTRSYDSVVHDLREKLSFFKHRSRDVDKLTGELVELQRKLKNMESVQLALDGSREQVNEMLRNEENVESLALLAATLKKALLDAERKKRESDFKYRQTQNDFTKYKREIAALEMQNKTLKQEIEEMRKEKEYLRGKIMGLDEKLKDIQSPNVSLKRIITESPAPYSSSSNFEGKKTEDVEANLEEKNKAPEVPSPYLQIKSSSYNNYSTLRTNKLSQSAANKLTIFKHSIRKPEDVRTNNMQKILQQSSYNGLGGHSKEDLFPTPKATLAGVKRPKSVTTISSSKFRKLGPTPIPKKC